RLLASPYSEQLPSTVGVVDEEGMVTAVAGALTGAGRGALAWAAEPAPTSNSDSKQPATSNALRPKWCMVGLPVNADERVATMGCRAGRSVTVGLHPIVA